MCSHECWQEAWPHASGYQRMQYDTVFCCISTSYCKQEQLHDSAAYIRMFDTCSAMRAGMPGERQLPGAAWPAKAAA